MFEKSQRLNLSLTKYPPLLRIVGVFVVRELREQYAGTLLGAGWAFLQPLLSIAIYWWVFGVVWAHRVQGMERGAEGYPFIVFLLSAFLPWLAFQDSINKSAIAVIQRVAILRQGAFPVIVFPLAKCVSAHLVFLLFILVYLLAISDIPTLFGSGALFFVVLLYLLQLMFALGVGLALAALTVYVQDLAHLLGMFLTFLLFTSPIFYPLSQVPADKQEWVWFNPYTPFAQGFHALILDQNMPPDRVWIYAAALASVSAVVGAYLFKRLRPGFADVV